MKIRKPKNPSKKGDSSNPNNWRGINFFDVVSKLMSITINTRIQEALKTYETLLQFGASLNMGCLEVSFFLRSLLQMRKEYNLQSWVVFVHLIKPFNSIDHKFLFALFEKLLFQIVLFKRLKFVQEFKD